MLTCMFINSYFILDQLHLRQFLPTWISIFMLIMFMLQRAEKVSKLKEKETIREIQKEKLQTVSANVCII